MKRRDTFKRLATLVLPGLLFLGCGSSSSGSTGGSSGSTGSSCAGGATTYSVGATYNTITASNIVDGCQDGLSPTTPGLIAARTVAADPTSKTVTVTSAANGSVLGAGPVSCNTGTLSNGPTVLDDGTCNWSSTHTIDFNATADYTITLDVTDVRTDFKSSPGGAGCQRSASCTTKYTLTMTK